MSHCGKQENAIIAKFDEDMSHIDKWVITIDTSGEDQRAYWKSIDFFADGSIVMCANVYDGFYVARLFSAIFSWDFISA